MPHLHYLCDQVYMVRRFCKGGQQRKYTSLNIYFPKDERIDKIYLEEDSPNESWKSSLLVPELPLNMIVTWIKLLKLTEHKFFHI